MENKIKIVLLGITIRKTVEGYINFYQVLLT